MIMSECNEMRGGFWGTLLRSAVQVAPAMAFSMLCGAGIRRLVTTQVGGGRGFSWTAPLRSTGPTRSTLPARNARRFRAPTRADARPRGAEKARLVTFLMAQIPGSHLRDPRDPDLLPEGVS